MKTVLALALVALLAAGAPAEAKKVIKQPKIKNADASTVRIEDFAPPALTPDNTWNLDLNDGGRVVIQLRPDKAPKMVERIKTLTRQGFYTNLNFHRVIEGFMAQGGDPRGTGEGGSTLPDVPAEFNDLPHVRGTVAAARAASEDSANSQFYIMLMPNLKLDKHYTVFGRVVSGMQYVDAIQKGEPPANPTKIAQASIGNEPPLLAAQPIVTAPVPGSAPPPPSITSGAAAAGTAPAAQTPAPGQSFAPAALPSGPMTPAAAPSSAAPAKKAKKQPH